MDADATVVFPRFGIPEFVEIDQRTAFVHPTTGLSYGVNDTARSIWDALRSEHTIDGVARRLTSDFDVSSDDARRAVSGFIARMAELGLVEVTKPRDALASMRARYLDLLRRALVNLIYPEHELRIEALESGQTSRDLHARDRELRDIRYRHSDDYSGLVAAKLNGDVWRGRPWRYSHTMVGMRRLEHLQWCAERVFEDGVTGDFLEAGVCQGGASIFMRALQVAYDIDRVMWVADSFQGLPAPDHALDDGYDFSEAKQPWLAMSKTVVEDNFRTYDLLSGGVKFLPGLVQRNAATCAGAGARDSPHRRRPLRVDARRADVAVRQSDARRVRDHRRLQRIQAMPRGRRRISRTTEDRRTAASHRPHGRVLAQELLRFGADGTSYPPAASVASRWRKPRSLRAAHRVDEGAVRRRRSL